MSTYMCLYVHICVNMSSSIDICLDTFICISHVRPYVTYYMPICIRVWPAVPTHMHLYLSICILMCQYVFMFQHVSTYMCQYVYCLNISMYICVYLQQSPCSCHNNLQIARAQYWTYISIELVVRSKILQKFPNMVVEEAGADILLVKNRPVQTIDWSTGAGVYTWLVKRGRCIYLIGQKGPVYIFNWSTGAGADISLVNRGQCRYFIGQQGMMCAKQSFLVENTVAMCNHYILAVN